MNIIERIESVIGEAMLAAFRGIDHFLGNVFPWLVAGFCIVGVICGIVKSIFDKIRGRK